MNTDWKVEDEKVIKRGKERKTENKRIDTFVLKNKLRKGTS